MYLWSAERPMNPMLTDFVETFAYGRIRGADRSSLLVRRCGGFPQVRLLDPWFLSLYMLASAVGSCSSPATRSISPRSRLRQRDDTTTERSKLGSHSRGKPCLQSPESESEQTAGKNTRFSLRKPPTCRSQQIVTPGPRTVLASRYLPGRSPNRRVTSTPVRSANRSRTICPAFVRTVPRPISTGSIGGLWDRSLRIGFSVSTACGGPVEPKARHPPGISRRRARPA